MSYDTLHLINREVIECTRCSRLSEYIKQIGQKKVKRFISEEYWARPLPSWGDPNARLLIVGLAPAAHGGNRTGRMFTGDGSGDWLARAMYESGFANIPTSRSKDDGLVLKDAYITAAIRCAPPDNKPMTIELMNCSQYLVSELNTLKNIKVILMLGKIGFDAYCRAAGLRKLRFSHGASYEINGKTLLASYHPSRQNTNTGKLTWQMWLDIFKKVRSTLGS
ncbi:MAG: uracil-DNA glycosylase [Thermoproteota archaeon]|nr:uracil-DNA glycosylase [Thermoproteota archaeon]